ncbi:hypothetical protein K503DRAFT_592273 [Rhizopogon vinicolor AM-OR11-026]|uniref:Uncharacterized protein n=1 Tax=Rhizopogon vinicolor AM-OR11-026 TaxID=1314800 RepID=A0A1B7MJ69_9AGAM|nr:hypothetical protein K503DRAFT_592273 [Rhizopogon vinicolor AM-OR11-026]
MHYGTISHCPTVKPPKMLYIMRYTSGLSIFKSSFNVDNLDVIVYCIGYVCLLFLALYTLHLHLHNHPATPPQPLLS